MITWLVAAHLIGVLLWVAGLSTVFWMLRFHTQAPKEAHDKLVLMERSLALAMDLGAALAIIAGLWLAIEIKAFSRPGGGWFHIKLTLVVLGLLSMHGLLRARVAKFSRGETPTVPSWAWSVILVAITAIVILVFRGPLMFAK